VKLLALAIWNDLHLHEDEYARTGNLSELGLLPKALTESNSGSSLVTTSECKAIAHRWSPVRSRLEESLVLDSH
jgi:hypothetical protein